MEYATLTKRNRIDGLLVGPQDPNWDAARQAWNLAADQRPAAVALPDSARDVADIVEFAKQTGYRIAPQGTGHNAHPLGDLSDTILLKTSRMTGVTIDPVARRARVRAGALWADVTAAAGEHGLAPLAGSSPDVGVVGYSLGGGISWLGRKYGLAANSVLAIEIVTADGEILRADRVQEPDLFWALRGGGGNFGVVTELEMALYPVSELYAGWLIWDIERAAEVLKTWTEWTKTVPDEVTSIGRILQLPPIPDIPEPLRGRRLVVVEAAILSGPAERNALLAPLRALAPEMDTFEVIPASALNRLHQDPDHPVPGFGDHMLLGGAPADAIDALVGVAGADSGSPLLSVELRHLGGALGRPEPEAGALSHIDAEYAMFAVGMAMDEQMGAAVKAHLSVVKDALAPWDAGREYLNFAERATDVSRLFNGDAYGRLQKVKAEYDPGDMFRANHAVPPLSE